MNKSNSEKLTFLYVTDDSGMEQFWKLRDKYMTEDVIPNGDPPLSEDEIKWFFSKEYKDHMMKLFHREIDTLRAAYLLKDGEYAGFIEYVTYGSEDGKCFIVEYCIERSKRGAGLGKHFFKRFEEEEKLRGAIYFALNTSNEHNRRFWLSKGFVKGEEDEYGNPVYIKTYN